MPNGGNSGLSGAQLLASRLGDPRVITALAFAGFGLLHVVVNAASLVDQRRALGRPIEVWQAWVLEGTSFAAWLILLPIVLALTLRLATRPVWQVFVGHALGYLAVSLAHTALMTALRSAAYAVGGVDYDPLGPWSERMLFEARKDMITYASILAVFLLARKLTSRPVARQPLPSPAAVIEVRDGSRLVILKPGEVDWVSAAGNYVELCGSFGSELARRTMAEMETELDPHGFIRVHRSHLVRRDAIARTETRKSGDFDITLRSGVVISGSRRFRHRLGGGV